MAHTKCVGFAPKLQGEIGTFAAMSEMGQTRKSGDAITTSAPPPTADTPESGCDVRKVPTGDSVGLSDKPLRDLRSIVFWVEPWGAV